MMKVEKNCLGRLAFIVFSCEMHQYTTQPKRPVLIREVSKPPQSYSTIIDYYSYPWFRSFFQPRASGKISKDQRQFRIECQICIPLHHHSACHWFKKFTLAIFNTFIVNLCGLNNIHNYLNKFWWNRVICDSPRYFKWSIYITFFIISFIWCDK